MPDTISIVVPFFNEEEVLPAFFEELRASLKDAPFEYEVVAVDDGSRDKTFALLSSYAADDPRIRVARLSRNFGHQLALKAGLDLAGGDAVVTIDGDLQDPPAVILEMAAKWKEGFDVLYAVRRRREGEPFWRKIAIAFYYRLLSGVSRLPVPPDAGDFRLLSRRAADHMRAVDDPMPYHRGLASWIGFPQSVVLYDRRARAAGRSKYGLRKLFQLAWNGITSLSHLPLRLATYAGLGFAGAAFGLGFFLILGHIFFRWEPATWIPIVLAVAFLGGVQLLSVGILGEYVARIHERVHKRPSYLLQETLNIPSQRGSRTQPSEESRKP